MSGIGEAAAVTGVLGFGLHQIHKSFILIYTARDFGTDADRARRSFEWEHYRLREWEEACLDGRDQGHEVSFNPDAEVDRSSSATISDQGPCEQSLGGIDWGQVKGLLDELDVLGPEHRKLEKRYNLKLSETEETVNEADARGSIGNLVPERWMRKKVELVSARKIGSKASALKKLKWAVFDKDRFEGLLVHVQQVVDKLHWMLSRSEQKILMSKLDSALRHGIKSITSTEDLQFVGSLRATSEIPNNHSKRTEEALSIIKMIRLAYKIDEKAPNAQSSMDNEPDTVQWNFLKTKRARVKRAKDLAMAAGKLRRKSEWKMKANREIAKLDGKWILLEWKTILLPNNARDVRNFKYRIEGLGILLSEVRDSSFHALPCRGYFEEGASFAFVFDLPFHELTSRLSETCSVALMPITIDGILSISSGLDPSCPGVFSLKDVLESPHFEIAEPQTKRLLAIAIAETVLQLHTAGWLHKAIRSENILLIQRGIIVSGAETEFKGPFLAGYDFARENDPRDLSDEMPSAPELDIYRHPHALGPARLSFHPGFDVWALGIVLLEIGLWRNIDKILDASVRRLLLERQKAAILTDHLHEVGRDSVMAQVRAAVGTSFADAILLCFEPEFFFASRQVATPTELVVEDLDNSVSLQEAIVSKLEALSSKY